METEIKETYRPLLGITYKVVDKVISLVQFHVVQLVVHGCFVDSLVHVELVHEVTSTLKGFLLADAGNRSLIPLLLFNGLRTNLFS